MRQKRKKILTATTVFVMLFVLLQINISAASNERPNYTSAVTSYSDLLARMDTLVNKYSGTYWTTNGRPSDSIGSTSKYYYGIQCKGFANYIFNDLFCGGYIGAYDSNKYYIPNAQGAVLVDKAWGISASDTGTVKNILKKSSIGDFIQVHRRGKDYGHSMIVQGLDDNGIAVFDCNSDRQCGVKHYYQTWAEFASKNDGLSLYHSTKYPPLEHNPEGNLDSVTSNDYGMLTVTGWALDRDVPNEALQIHIYVGGPADSSSARGFVIIANASRNDVGQALGFGNNHGFCSEINVGCVGKQEVYVYAIGVGGGGNVQLGHQTVDIVSNHKPIGDLEQCVASKGKLHLAGWAFDEDTPEQPVNIHVYVDDKFVGGCTTSESRQDVVHEYAPNGISVLEKCGFNFDVDVSVYGNRKVCVYVIDSAGGKNALIKTWSVDIPDDNIPFGKVEGIQADGDKVRIWGWAFDEDAPKNAINIHVYEKDPSTGKENYIAGGNANVSRKDVEKEYASKGIGDNHGFDLTFTVSDAGTKTFIVYAINDNSARPNTKLDEVKRINHTPTGNLDKYTVSKGKIHLEGWAFDEDSPKQPIDIHAYVDDEFVGGCTTSEVRQDVLDMYASKDILKECGFSFDVDVNGSGKKNVCVYAIDSAGEDNLLLKEWLVDVPDDSVPIGSAEGVQADGEKVRIWGWAFDEDVPRKAISIHIYEKDQSTGEEKYIGGCSADIERKDVGKEYASKDIGDNHGFDFTFTVNGSGIKTFIVYAINDNSTRANKMIGSQQVIVLQTPSQSDCSMGKHTIVVDPAVEATIEYDGLTQGSHCSVCGIIIEKQEIIPALDEPDIENSLNLADPGKYDQEINDIVTNEPEIEESEDSEPNNPGKNEAKIENPIGAGSDDDTYDKLYTVTYDPNGGVCDSKESVIIDGNKIGYLDMATRPGYLFQGWYTQKKGGKRVTKLTVVKCDMTIYARWCKVSKPSVSSKIVLKNLRAKKLQVTWKKVSKAVGYEVDISRKRKFPSRNTSKKYTKGTKVTMTDAVKGTKYYVRVRAYKLDSSGKKIYGKYSSVKSIKIKK